MPLIITTASTGVHAPVVPPVDLLDFRVSLTQGDNELSLSGGFRVLAGVEGLDDPVMSPVVDEAPGVWGGFSAGLQVPSREVVLPVLVEGRGGQALAHLRGVLRLVTNPVAGPTLVKVTDGNGLVHRISGTRFVDSPIAWDTQTWAAWGWQLMALQFRCPNPWWRRHGAVTTTPWTNPTSGGFLGSAFLPVRPSSSAVFGAPATVTVPGEVPALPVWTLTGSATALAVTHTETGRTWTVDVDGLTRPVIVRADPDPTVLAVEDGAGVDQWSKLAAPYDLFPLPPGRQTVEVTVTGADDTTRVEMTADSLHLSVLG